MLYDHPQYVQYQQNLAARPRMIGPPMQRPPGFGYGGGPVGPPVGPGMFPRPPVLNTGDLWSRYLQLMRQRQQTGLGG